MDKRKRKLLATLPRALRKTISYFKPVVTPAEAKKRRVAQKRTTY